VKRFDALEKLIADHHLAPELVAKIRKYLFRRVEKWDPLDLINDLPSKLRTEFLIQIHDDVLAKIPFLQDKNPVFASEVLGSLKVRLFQLQESQGCIVPQVRLPLHFMLNSW